MGWLIGWWQGFGDPTGDYVLFVCFVITTLDVDAGVLALADVEDQRLYVAGAIRFAVFWNESGARVRVLDNMCLWFVCFARVTSGVYVL